MNDEALNVKWFSNNKGTVGIAKVQTAHDGIEYRISSVDGFLEHMDVQQIVAWGARFPDDVGAFMFGDKP